MKHQYRFDAEKHAYYCDDMRLSSVTQIVSGVTACGQYGNEWHLHRGKMLHKAIALFLRGELDETSVDEAITQQFLAAKKAIVELDLLQEVMTIEEPVYDKRLMIAGTPDVWLPQTKTIVDWKSSFSPTCELQLGGYATLIPAAKKLLAVILNDNGTYRLYEYKPLPSKNLFRAMLTVYNWRQKNER